MSSPSAAETLAFVHQLTDKLRAVYPETADQEIKQMLQALTQEDLLGFFTGDAFLNPDEKDTLEEWVNERCTHKPIAHILGEAPFMDLSLRLTGNTFIPRPETELLVQEAIRLCREQRLERSRPMRILDLGSGSGNIAVGVASKVPSAHVDAVECWPDAVLSTTHNIGIHELDKRVRVHTMNYLTDGWEGRLQDEYDLILSNPPYIPRDDFETLPREVQNEPWLALIGGDRGDEVLRSIIEKGRRFLPNGGRILLEIGIGQVRPVAKFIETFPDLLLEKVILDHQSIERVLVIQRTFNKKEN